MSRNDALRADDSDGSSAVVVHRLSRMSGSRLSIRSLEQDLNQVETNLDQEDQE